MGGIPKLEFRADLVQSKLMQIHVETNALQAVEADALIILTFEDRKEDRFGAAELMAAGEITGKALEMTLLHDPPGIAAKRGLLAAAGKPEKFDPGVLRKVVGAAPRHLKAKSVKKVTLVLEGGHSGPEFASAAVEGAILGD